MIKSLMLLIPEFAVTIRQDPNRGRSLILTQDVEPGTVIGDYMGVFYKEEDDAKLEETDGLYSMEYDEHHIIFPTEKERNSKDVPLINHSCEENCGIISYRYHALYYALRKLFKGEELTVCYSISPDDAVSPMAKYQCHCGSDFCRGTFCISLQDIKVIDAFESGLPGDDGPAEPPVLGAHQLRLGSYPPSIPDYVEFDIYGSVAVDPIVLEDTVMVPISQLRLKIRESGRRILFKNLRLMVRGIRKNTILTEFYPLSQ